MPLTHFLKLALAILVGLPLTLTRLKAEAEIVDRIDFETGDFSQVKQLQARGRGIRGKLVNSPSRQGEYAALFGFEAGNVNQGYDRSELAAKYRATPGKEYWYGWSLYIPEDFEGAKRGIVVSQLHGYNPRYLSKGKFFQLSVKDDKWHLWLEFQKDPKLEITGNSTGPYRKILQKDTERVQKGKWTDFVVRVKWTHENDGFFQLWIDGKQVVDHRGATYFNVPNGPLFKAGAYKRTDHGRSFVYVDEVRVGNHKSSYREVVPGGSHSKSKVSSSSSSNGENLSLRSVFRSSQP